MTDGIPIRPHWRIIPPGGTVEGGEIGIIVKPGAGWGTGAHETTQLCLQAIAMMVPKHDPQSGWSLLDFGSGSGILSIGGARLGACVTAIEIDEEGIANAEENARLNGVGDRIQSARALEVKEERFDVVVANILRPILLDFAKSLCAHLAPGGTLILSGLVATDLPEVGTRYASFLSGRQPVIYKRGEWRALIWRTRDA